MQALENKILFRQWWSVKDELGLHGTGQIYIQAIKKITRQCNGQMKKKKYICKDKQNKEIFFVQVRLRQKYYMHPKFDLTRFEPMASGSWQCFISLRPALPNHLAIQGLFIWTGCCRLWSITSLLPTMIPTIVTCHKIIVHYLPELLLHSDASGRLHYVIDCLHCWLCNVPRVIHQAYQTLAMMEHIFILWTHCPLAI